MGRLEIVKIGGNVIDNPEKLGLFLNDFSKLAGNKILVHGGGKEATRLSSALGIQTTQIDGRRVTDRATLDVVTMVYAGLINKDITARLQALGCDAVGLSGADGNAIPATIRAPEPIDYGFVGDIDSAKINTQFIRSILNEEKTPVFCAICHDGQGTLLNCNADTIASKLAVALSGEFDVTLTYCFEKRGVMRNIEDENSVIACVTPESFLGLKEEGIVDKGMLPKLENALRAVGDGVEAVRICSFSDLNRKGGTIIRQ